MTFLKKLTLILLAAAGLINAAEQRLDQKEAQARTRSEDIALTSHNTSKLVINSTTTYK